MNLTCNDFDESSSNEILQIFETYLQKIKDSSDVKNNPNWEHYLSEESLISIISQEVPHNRNSNLSRLDIESPGEAIKKIVQKVYPDNFIWFSGYFYYPPTGYMGWHTNHNDPAIRLYINYASEDKKSFFRYYHNGKIVTDYDRKGLNIRKFKCPGKRPYFWHCVGSECDRISIGFTIKYHTINFETPMAKYAIIENEKVINLVNWNGDTNIWSPPSGTTTALVGDSSVGIGMTYKDGSFQIPAVVYEEPTVSKWATIREARDKKIAESDWMGNSDVTMSSAWTTYRQALRDLPASASNPDDIVWPTEPS